MPSKTTDIEFAIVDLLDDGPATLDQLMNRLGWVGDPRWIAVALMHLNRDKKIRYTTCDGDHNHSGGCTVDLSR